MVTFGFPSEYLTRAENVVEEFMADTATVERTDDTRVWDESTGRSTTGTATEIYSGKCRIAPTSPSVEVVGNELVAWRDADFYFPVDSPQFHVGDLITVTASRDANLVGRVWRVTAVRHGTFTVSNKVSARSQGESPTADNIT